MRDRRGLPAVALTAIALIVLVWAASSEVSVLPAPSVSDPVTIELPSASPTQDEMTAPGLPTPPPEEPGTRTTARWDIVTAVVGLILATLAALLLLRLWRWWRRRLPGGEEPADDEADVEELLRATGARAQQRAAAAGDPRNAIVACWVSLEDAAEQAGLARDAAETATEFTIRVLATWDVDPATITELADLYRAARFSRRPVTEDHRTCAIDALARIHRAITDAQVLA